MPKFIIRADDDDWSGIPDARRKQSRAIDHVKEFLESGMTNMEIDVNEWADTWGLTGKAREKAASRARQAINNYAAKTGARVVAIRRGTKLYIVRGTKESVGLGINTGASRKLADDELEESGNGSESGNDD
jgi:hypothetical protein